MSRRSNQQKLFPNSNRMQVSFVYGSDTSVCRPESTIKEQVQTKKPCLPATKYDNSNTKSLERFQNLQKQNSLIPHIVSDKSHVDISTGFVKRICKGISFAEDVVEERSPHTIPYVQSKIDSIYKENSLIKRHKQKVDVSSSEKAHAKPHMPCHLTPIKNDILSKTTTETIKRSTSTDSFLLGVSSSMENLKANLIKDHNVSTTNLNNKNSICNKEQNKPTHTWDEHVLSMLSKSTANIILKDFTPNNQQEESLRNFLNFHSNNLTINSIADKNTELVENRDGDNNVLVDGKMDTGNELDEQYFQDKCKLTGGIVSHEKVMQEYFPCSPSLWCSAEKNSSENENRKMYKKGMQKWTAYPKLVESENLQLQRFSRADIISPVSEVILRQATAQRHNKKLSDVVDEWRAKWLLEKKWQSKPLSELQESMNDINDHVRLAVVTAASKVILEHRQQANLENSIDKEEGMIDIETSILEEILRHLNDKCRYVALAAAVTLYSVNRGVHKATELLMDFVKNGAQTERWLAVQCLAEYEHFDDCIIIELLSHINGMDIVKHKKAGELLKHLSHFTISIQYMLAEQLNSANWRDRVIACQIFPTLHGLLTKDIANKLSYLMWNDWNMDVRTSAAQVLGKTGNGKLVHDALCERLNGLNQVDQIDALKKISSLGVMTAHLLKSFICCLQSKNELVCLQAIKTASSIKICDEKVTDILCNIIDLDRDWKVKAHTIKALGRIGTKSQRLRNSLVWALHYEKESAVRIEACATISKLGLKDEEIIKVLQDMITVEEDANVKSQVAIALYSMGLEPTGDASMTDAVRQNVKKLCRKNNVIAHVLLDNEDDGDNPTQGCEELENSVNSSSMDKGFDPILEAYRARTQFEERNINLPDIQDSFIPYFDELQ